MLPFLFKHLPFSWPFAGPSLIAFLTAAACAFVFAWYMFVSEGKPRKRITGIAIGLLAAFIGAGVLLLGVYEHKSTLSQAWTDFDTSCAYMILLVLVGGVFSLLYEMLFSVPTHSTWDTSIPVKRKDRRKRR